MDPTPTLAPPPRAVPLSLQARVVFGGVLAVVSWCMFGLGLVIAAFTLHFAEPLVDPFGSSPGTAEGTVAGIETTSMRINEEPVHAVFFTFRADGRPRRGVCYTTGSAPLGGAAVAVEYVLDAPDTARIAGTRTAILPRIAWFVALFPIVGAILLLVAIAKGLGRVRLLQHGMPANGRLVAALPTNVTINNQRVHELTFAFVDAAHQARTGVVRTHRLRDLRVGAEALLLHDPAGERIVLWDTLPRLAIDRDGQFAPAGLAGLVPVLLPVTLVAIAWTAVRAWLQG